MAVGLVIVSHSARLAEGVVELATQMTRDTVRLIPAGGMEDGGIGTSITKVTEALMRADTGEGVVALVDLGSAALITEMALEALDAAQRDRVRLSGGPLVEGAITAAVEASVGGSLDAVVATAESARSLEKLAR